MIIYNKIVELLQRETADFISLKLWPPNSPDLNPVDYKIWGIIQQRMYEMQIHNVDELKRRLVDVWSERSAAVLLTLLSANGESVCRRVFARREDISNTCCRLFR